MNDVLLVIMAYAFCIIRYLMLIIIFVICVFIIHVWVITAATDTRHNDTWEGYANQTVTKDCFKPNPRDSSQPSNLTVDGAGAVLLYFRKRLQSRFVWGLDMLLSVTLLIFLVTFCFLVARWFCDGDTGKFSTSEPDRTACIQPWLGNIDKMVSFHTVLSTN